MASRAEGGDRRRPVQVESLSPEQLQSLSLQLRQELGGLQQSAQMLSGAAQEYAHSREAIEEMATYEEGETMGPAGRFLKEVCQHPSHGWNLACCTVCTSVR